MNTKRLNRVKHPVVIIDNSLEKYKGKVIFKDKLDQANKMLKTYDVPKSAQKPS